MDRSNGYEAVSKEFLASRGNNRTRSTAIGVKEVRKWAKTLPRGTSVIDLGCGPGFPITVVLVEEGLQVYGVDAAPSFVAAFLRNLPGIPIVCESVLESRLFDRIFDAVLLIGLMFLLKVEEQHRFIQRFAEILLPGGRLSCQRWYSPPAVPRDRSVDRIAISPQCVRIRSTLDGAALALQKVRVGGSIAIRFRCGCT
jgi:SAM-dependent methyltransferase